MKRRQQGPRILFIPDVQVVPDEDLAHVEWAAAYAATKKPEVIALAGDFYDMPSLSSYDEGQISAEGRRYQDDVDAGNRGLELFDRMLKRHAGRGYRPRKFVTLGNHEERIQRAISSNPKLEGKLSMEDLAFKRFGWTVYDFLEPVRCHGVTFAHYFPVGPNGSVVNSRRGAPSAAAQVKRMMTSCVAGHKQGLDVAVVNTPTSVKRGVIAGSYFRHDESYLTPMGNTFWRGILVLNDIRPERGEFDLCEVSLDYLERRYG